MIAIGNLPSGSKDPFALRRTANGIIRILAEGKIPLTLSQVHNAAVIESRFAKAGSTVEVCRTFLLERVSFYLREIKGHAYDVVAAVLASGADDIADALARADAVTSIRGSSDFSAVSVAFKRMKNILAQAKEANADASGRLALLHEAAEISLYKELQLRAKVIENLRTGRDYVGALVEITRFGPILTEFFQQVMVMSDDLDVRASRIKLLSEVFREFVQIADFSEIVVTG
jgi:glycyl-tRNA synthetase beta chain